MNSECDRNLLQVAIPCRVGTAHQPLKALEGRKVYSNAESLHVKGPEGSTKRIAKAIGIFL